MGALSIIALALLVPAAIALWFATSFVGLMKKASEAPQTQVEESGSLPTDDDARSGDEEDREIDNPGLAGEVAAKDLDRLDAAVKAYRKQYGKLPGDGRMMYTALRLYDPAAGELLDPFDGYRYGYTLKNGQYEISSSGARLPQFEETLVRRGQ